jgi:hypothetical protein
MSLSSMASEFYVDTNINDPELLSSTAHQQQLLPPSASQSHEDVQGAGTPALPLDFPTPNVHRCTYRDTTAMDHRHGRVYQVRVLTRLRGSSGGIGRHSGSDSGSSSDATKNATAAAYLMKKKLCSTVYGSIRLCVVLRKRHKFHCGGVQEAEWISTDEFVAVKVSSWSQIRSLRGKHLEDPLKGT